MADDAELLRRYAEEKSEDAFTELVNRHVGIVYGAAIRQVQDPHGAKDVAQVVFTSLARNAATLRHRAVIIGWLYTTTHYAASKLLRSERRRHIREQESLTMQEHGSPGREPSWDRLRPVLDEAMHDLAEPDREVVLLRYFEGLTFAEIARPLSVSEDGARKRVDRALESLRFGLARRGINSTSAALAAALAAQPTIATPAGLAASLVSGAISGSGLVSGATVLTLMNAKVIIPATILALVGFFGGSYYQKGRVETVAPSPIDSRSPQIITSLRRENVQLAAEAEDLKRDIARLTEKAGVAEAQLAARPPVPTPRSISLGVAEYQLEAEVMNNLRQINAALDAYYRQYGRRPNAITDFVGEGSPDPFIKAIRSSNGEDYSAISMDPSEPLTVTMANGKQITFDPAGVNTTHIEVPAEVLAARTAAELRTNRVQELSRVLMSGTNSPFAQASAAYREANNGAAPVDPNALTPYFATAELRAAATEFIQLQTQTRK